MITKAEKRKWVKALLSGNYKQGKNNLHNNGRYCCLGVFLADVRKVDKTELTEVPMPCDVNAAGKNIVNHQVDNELASLNDGKISWDEVDIPAMPFEVIAGVIDQWVPTAD